LIDFARTQVLTFDCYGTLIDWEAGILSAIRPVFRAHSVEVSDGSVLELYGSLESSAESGAYRPYREILREVMVGMGKTFEFEPTPIELDALANSVGDWPAFADTPTALEALKKRFKLGIISNIDDDLFAASNRHLGVTFDWVITAQQAHSYKPSTHNFRIALDRIGLPQEQVVHVAQSLFHDHVPAKSLGLTTVWVNRRAGKSGPGATPPANAQPDLEVPDLQTLASLLEVSTNHKIDFHQPAGYRAVCS
jgi:2-haloacid dehalogenase